MNDKTELAGSALIGGEKLIKADALTVVPKLIAINESSFMQLIETIDRQTKIIETLTNNRNNK